MWLLLDLALEWGWRRWPRVVAFEGQIGLVMKCAWDGLGGLLGWAGHAHCASLQS